MTQATYARFQTSQRCWSPTWTNKLPIACSCALVNQYLAMENTSPNGDFSLTDWREQRRSIHIPALPPSNSSCWPDNLGTLKWKTIYAPLSPWENAHISDLFFSRKTCETWEFECENCGFLTLPLCIKPLKTMENAGIPRFKKGVGSPTGPARSPAVSFTRGYGQYMMIYRIP